MAAPTRDLFGTPATTGAVNSDTLTCAMSTMASGSLASRDKIVVLCSSDGIQTQTVHASSGAGWTKIIQRNETGSSAVCLALYEFNVTVSGTVGDLVIDMGATTEMAIAHIFRIRASAGGAISSLTATLNSGSSTNPNPLLITNDSGASRDVLVIAAWGGDGNNVLSTLAPTNYGNHQSDGIASSTGSNIGTADRTITIASGGTEDPGVFTRATEQWATITVGYYEVVTSPTLTASSGSYALTGTAASLKAGRLLTAASGSYALTGTTTPLRAARRITATSGSYALTGTVVTPRTARLLGAASGAYVRTGTAVTLSAGHTLAATTGSYALSGSSAAFPITRYSAPASGAYVLTGTAAGLRAARLLTAIAGSYTLTGTSAGLTASASNTLAAASGSYVLSGTSVTLETDRLLSAVAGSYTLSGTVTSLTVARSVALTTGAYNLAGSAVGFAKGFAVSCDAGSYALTGTSIALNQTHVLIAVPGAYTFTGSAATLLKLSATFGPSRVATVGAQQRLVTAEAMPRRQIVEAQDRRAAVAASSRLVHAEPGPRQVSTGGDERLAEA